MKAKKRKRFRILGKILFVLYIAFLLYFLILADWYGRSRQMQNYRSQIGWVAYANLFGNVLIFIPFGFFMPMASRYRSFFLTTVYSFGLSFLVETFQLVSRVGSFDVDDLLLNTIGGILGYIIFGICNTIRRWLDADQKRKRYRT